MSGQIEHVGPGTVASIDRLTGDVERVLEGGHVEVRKVDVKTVDLSRGKEDTKTSVEEMKKGKRCKGCVTM